MKLNVLMVAAEVDPFFKSGGLGDVVGSLPKALNRFYCTSKVIMPLYSKIKKEYREKMEYLGYFYIDLSWRHQYCGLFHLEYNNVDYYFLDNEYYYKTDNLYDELELERFAFLDLACFEVCKFLNYKPDIIHTHDWHTGAIAALYNDYYGKDELFKDSKIIYSIHNLAYQGIFAKDKVLDLLPLDANKFQDTNSINLMALGIIYAHKVNTVSNTYANEIKTDTYGEGLQYLLRKEENKLSGILNGIDTKNYDPKTDKLIYKRYKKEDYEKGKLFNKKELLHDLGLTNIDYPLISIISRLASQKGMDLFLNIIDRLLENNVNVIILGTGAKELEEAFKEKQNNHYDKFRALITFNNELAHKIYAASDLLLMPSAFEPCGLAQMIALRYGTLPLVRATGGLKDSIIPFNEYSLEGNGFSFENYNASDFYNTIMYALSVYERKELWNKVISNALASDFSWGSSAKEYKALYKEARK